MQLFQEITPEIQLNTTPKHALPAVMFPVWVFRVQKLLGVQVNNRLATHVPLSPSDFLRPAAGAFVKNTSALNSLKFYSQISAQEMEIELCMPTHTHIYDHTFVTCAKNKSAFAWKSLTKQCSVKLCKCKCKLAVYFSWKVNKQKTFRMFTQSFHTCIDLVA